ncbi:MAG: TonB family protein [Acidobacteria bacterium]|nr:TonB family protein [Acidobacteriota bacterium]
MGETYRTFGQFILFKEILEDEMGHLYRAGEFDATGITRTVWLRLFDSTGMPSKEVNDAFEKGRQVADLLQAANIASGTSYHTEGGIPGMAFEYTASQPLSRLFEKVKEEGFPVPVDNALLIMEKLALGLSSALVLESGGQPLAHGFLHPALVVISNDGEGIISGFGAAESLLGLLDQPDIAEKIKPYLAPEVILTRTAGKKGDVYSLGALLFQLLTSTSLPSDPEARTAAIDEAEMAYDEEPIPDDIKALLTRSLATRPEDRFSSAADFKKHLDKLLYGGNYSPTTFNLALFMDRLFRSDIERDEADRGVEAQVDVQHYIQPEPEEEPVETVTVTEPAMGKGLYIGLAAGLIVILALIGFWVTRGSQPEEPVLTPEEVAAQRASQEERIRELAARLVEEKMQEQEAKIRGELEQSQQRIEDLQKKLQESQKRTTSAAEKKRAQEELQRQIESEKEKQRQQEAALERERQQALAEAQKEAEAKAEQELAAVEPETPPTAVAEAQPTAAPQVLEPTPAPVTVTENQFVDPSEVDTLPAIIKEETVKWPNAAKRARRRGMVIVQATVDATGRVESVKVLRADETGFGLPESVTDAVKKYLFKPGTKDGVRIKTYATVTKRYAFR